MTKKRITVLGGGTGTYTVLTGLKPHAVDISAIVSIADSGGSTGILRDAHGTLPAGDLRRAILALSEKNELWRKLFEYRFKEGPLEGHNPGNIIITALELMENDPIIGIQRAHELFAVRGQVIPVSSEPAVLHAVLQDGTHLVGEHVIDETINRPPIRRCYLGKPITANPAAINAIHEADLIVFAPGDLYTSLIPVLLVDGIITALKARKAPCVYVMSLATKIGQTQGFNASHFIQTLSEYLPSNTIDHVIMNSQRPSSDIEQYYRSHGEPLVENDLTEMNTYYRIHKAPLLARTAIEQVAGDALPRSLVRHDQAKLAELLLALI